MRQQTNIEAEVEQSLTKRCQMLCQGTNINTKTLLATDYLNHFNELIMLIDMLPAIPECLEDIKQWHYKSYEQHFMDSGFKDKKLAIAVYKLSPPPIKERFDRAIMELRVDIDNGISNLEKIIDEHIPEKTMLECKETSKILHKHIDIISSIIHGHNIKITYEETFDLETIETIQAEIDSLFA